MSLIHPRQQISLLRECTLPAHNFRYTPSLLHCMINKSNILPLQRYIIYHPHCATKESSSNNKPFERHEIWEGKRVLTTGHSTDAQKKKSAATRQTDDDAANVRYSLNNMLIILLVVCRGVERALNHTGIVWWVTAKYNHNNRAQNVRFISFVKTTPRWILRAC